MTCLDIVWQTTIPVILDSYVFLFALYDSVERLVVACARFFSEDMLIRTDTSRFLPIPARCYPAPLVKILLFWWVCQRYLNCDKTASKHWIQVIMLWVGGVTKHLICVAMLDGFSSGTGPLSKKLQHKMGHMLKLICPHFTTHRINQDQSLEERTQLCVYNNPFFCAVSSDA